MTETERIDDGFMYLFNKLGSAANDRDNINAKEGTEHDVRRVLNRIYEIGFADRKENVQRTMGSNGIVYDYWLNSKGLHFIDTLPREFDKLPYSYYLKLEEDEKALKKIRDDLDTKLKGISISNIRFTRLLAYASFFLALSLGVVQIVKFISKKNKPEQSNITSDQVKQFLQSQQRSEEHLRQLQETMFHADTSVKKVKIEK